MMSEQEFVTLYCEADEATRAEIESIVDTISNTDTGITSTKSRRYPRDINKVMEEYERKYSQRSNIYASEVTELIERSDNNFDLIMNCIHFGYVVGRRAEKRARYNRKKQGR